ncbi:anti-sigma factor [Streptomyces olivaceiscleroticus]|uniref:Regulator of SigK n=1 Tax=Streptomyces olivaceiscleroticus TaxID=68245 RepID=A0ABP3JWU4_9ACTN
MNDADLHTATGAYVLDALPEEERIRFEQHLRDCAACRQEVAELSATAARLGQAVAAVPPPELKDRVLHHIATVRQEPPPVGGDRFSGRVRRRSLPRLALAACLAAAVAFGGVAVWQHQEAREARSAAQQQAAELAAVLAAPDARVTTGKLSDGGSGTVVVSRAQNRAAFVASGLADLPGDKVYQLWFNDGGTMRAAGTFHPARGATATLLDGDLGKASGMGVTVEPAGGSRQPTTRPVALMDFPART